MVVFGGVLFWGGFLQTSEESLKNPWVHLKLLVGYPLESFGVVCTTVRDDNPIYTFDDI